MGGGPKREGAQGWGRLGCTGPGQQPVACGLGQCAACGSAAQPHGRNFTIRSPLECWSTGPAVERPHPRWQPWMLSAGARGLARRVSSRGTGNDLSPSPPRLLGARRRWRCLSHRDKAEGLPGRGPCGTAGGSSKKRREVRKASGHAIAHCRRLMSRPNVRSRVSRLGARPGGRYPGGGQWEVAEPRPCPCLP